MNKDLQLLINSLLPIKKTLLNLNGNKSSQTITIDDQYLGIYHFVLKTYELLILILLMGI
jgi:hypothetical protein